MFERRQPFSIMPKHLLRVAGISPIRPADEAALHPAFAPTPAFDGIRRSKPRPAAARFEKRTKIARARVGPAILRSPSDRQVWLLCDNQSPFARPPDTFGCQPFARGRDRVLRRATCARFRRSADTRCCARPRRNRYRKTLLALRYECAAH